MSLVYISVWGDSNHISNWKMIWHALNFQISMLTVEKMVIEEGISEYTVVYSSNFLVDIEI